MILVDLAANFFAEGDETSRVRARILKSAWAASNAAITEPPCLPVAPVTRRVRDIAKGTCEIKRRECRSERL